MAGEKLTKADFYCSYCDDYSDTLRCARCGHRAHSMWPVEDSYLTAGRQALQETPDA